VESLGDKLRIAREAKDISFDQAGKDTKIAVKHLMALELEDFSDFPGEAYITGFLRNYGAYLDLDVQELLSLYRALKIQEQPIPVEQLLKRPSPLPKIALGFGLAVVVFGLAAGVVLLITRPRNFGVSQPVSNTPDEYELGVDTTLEKRFFIDDSIMVSTGEDRHLIKLLNLTETVTILMPGGEEILELNEEKDLPLDDSGFVLRVKVVDFDKNDPSMGARLHFELNESPLEGVSEAVSTNTASITAQAASTVIFSSPNPYPFTLQANFQNYCMFRWEILQERDRRGQTERYFQRSDTPLDIQAQNGIRIWVSNAQAAKFQVIGGGRTVPIEIGGAGEVVVADIRWVRDEDNRFRLIVSRLESGNT
jgi:cytoskeletal protein RodZ